MEHPCHRISVVYQCQQGNSAEAILESFPSLKFADIHAVISYYLNHQDQVNDYLHDQEKKARIVREDIESDPAYKARVGDLACTDQISLQGTASGPIDTMPGLILVPQELQIGKAIEELTMIALCSDPTEWRDMVVYIPL